MRPKSEYEEVMRWVRMGLSSAEVARLTGIPQNTIKSWRVRGQGSLRSGPNHPRHVYEEAMRYVALGMNDCAISRLMQVPHRTIRRWRTEGLKEGRQGNDDLCPICGQGEMNEESYAYLLGLYLGDGFIAKAQRGVFRLEIYLDAKYPGIVNECGQALIDVRTNGSTAVGRRLRDGCFCVNAYWKHWTCLFPQHGEGLKHERPIRLFEWQQRIASTHPDRLLRGLIHSDGYRGDNRIKVGDKMYVYPRYQFCNRSRYSGDLLPGLRRVRRAMEANESNDHRCVAKRGRGAAG